MAASRMRRKCCRVAMDLAYSIKTVPAWTRAAVRRTSSACWALVFRKTWWCRRRPRPSDASAGCATSRERRQAGAPQALSRAADLGASELTRRRDKLGVVQNVAAFVSQGRLAVLRRLAGEIARVKVVKGHAQAVAQRANADRFHHARVAELRQHQLGIKDRRCLDTVGLDAPYKVRVRVLQPLDQLVERVLSVSNATVEGVRHGRGRRPEKKATMRLQRRGRAGVAVRATSDRTRNWPPTVGGR